VFGFMGMGCFADYTLDMMKGRDFAVSARGGSEKILIGHRDSEQLRSGCDETGVGLLFSARIITHIKIANNKNSKVEGCLISSTVNTTVGNSPGSWCVVRVHGVDLVERLSSRLGDWLPVVPQGWRGGPLRFRGKSAFR
jgi:hypothetical protein